MNYRVKGYAANPAGVIVGGIIVLAIGVGIGVAGTLYYMSKHQGGISDGDSLELLESDVPATQAVPDTESEILTETQPPSTEPVTENLSYIKVLVVGGDYVYKNEAYTLDEFVGIVRANPGLPVRIEEDGASLRAYDGLIEALDLVGAEYVESGQKQD
ncbi:MAG: hypothetical protein K6F80_05175 [Oscillospiraceae bacterium]|nr:hypothetical protein [Oscillospiraceae bacterium]